MYIEELETESGGWCQACVGLPYLGPASDLSQALSVALDACGFVRDLQAAMRVSLDAASSLTRCAIFTAPARERERLRRFVASLTRIEIAAPGSIETAGTVDAFDRLMTSFPQHQLRAVPCDLRHGAVWFAAQFRVGLRLNQLFLESRALGHPISYQMNAVPATGVSEHVRAARHNLLSMNRLVGLPQSLLNMQQQLTGALAASAYWVEEHVGSSSKDGLLATGQALRRYFQSACPDIKPPVVFGGGRSPDLVAAGLHSSVRATPQFDEASAMAATAADVAALLAWQPGPALAPALRRSPRPPDEATDRRVLTTPALQAQRLNVYGGDEPFVFVSYRHSDCPTILPLLRQFQLSGLRFWLDAGIPGSAEWTQVLEERISKCAILIVFLSQAAVDSKFVRREILMADALDKPILTIRMGEPELRWGLKLLLSQYQMVQLGAQPLDLLVQRALLAHGRSAALN